MSQITITNDTAGVSLEESSLNEEVTTETNGAGTVIKCGQHATKSGDKKDRLIISCPTDLVTLGITAGSTIDLVKMRLNCGIASTTTATMFWKRITQAWVEATVSWANRQTGLTIPWTVAGGTTTETNRISFSLPTTTGWFEYTITDMWQDALDLAVDFSAISVASIIGSGTIQCQYRPQEGGTLIPEFVIDYTEPVVSSGTTMTRPTVYRPRPVNMPAKVRPRAASLKTK